MNECKLIKSLDVNGVSVNVFSNRLIKIYGKDQLASDAVMRYMELEGVLDDLIWNTN